MESISLYELNEYIQRVLALNFQEPLWVHFELSQVGESRGHWYLDCIETGVSGDEVLAQMQAVIWRSNFQNIANKHGAIIRELLQAGIKINALVKVDFHTRYGLKLQILDIDPSYTIGEIEIHRQEIISRLQEEGLYDFNRELVLPDIIKRIAVISSSGAAGYEDFKIHLRDNPYGYTFYTRLFDASMQGNKTEAEVCARLGQIAEEEFDIIAIVRGGGSRMDLSAFDSYEIGVKIAYAALPVLTGIGHEKDISVTDLVANTALKTPTALANFIVDHNAAFEAKLIDLAQAISNLALSKIQSESYTLSQFEHQLRYSIQNILLGQVSQLELLHNNLKHTGNKYLKEHYTQLENLSNKIHALDPQRVLARGYSLSYVNGNKINSIKDVQLDDEMQTILADGIITSKITDKNGK